MKPATREQLLPRFMAAVEDLRSEADRVRALEWMGAAVEGDDLDRSIVEALLNGHMKVAGFNDAGDIMFRTTEKGRDEQLELLHRSPEARAMLERLTKQRVADPPKDPQ